MPTTPGITNPQAENSHGVPALADPATAPCPAPLAVPDLVTRVRVGSRQLQVLRLLYTRRLLTAAQVQALALEIATRRIDGVPVRVYGPAKTVADCFKFRNKVGPDVAIEALRDCVAQRLSTDDEP